MTQKRLEACSHAERRNEGYKIRGLSQPFLGRQKQNTRRPLTRPYNSRVRVPSLLSRHDGAATVLFYQATLKLTP